MMAGRATFYSGARLVAAAEKAFEELVARFPETPHVHYAFGSFLVNEQADRALEEFKAELKVSPRHPLAKLQIAYEYSAAVSGMRRDPGRSRPSPKRPPISPHARHTVGAAREW